MGRKSREKRQHQTVNGDGKNQNVKRKKHIIWLFIIGIAFIVISIILSMTYYHYSEKLAEKNEAYRLYGIDILLYQINEQSTINTSFMILLGTEMVPPYKNLDYFKNHFHVQNIETLSSLHRALFGKDPDHDLVEKWKKIYESNKFQDEKKKMFDQAIERSGNKTEGGPTKFGLNLFNEIENLTKKMHLLMTASVILQILGVVLNQVGIILQIVWKEGT